MFSVNLNNKQGVLLLFLGMVSFTVFYPEEFLSATDNDQLTIAYDSQSCRSTFDPDQNQKFQAFRHNLRKANAQLCCGSSEEALEMVRAVKKYENEDPDRYFKIVEEHETSRVFNDPQYLSKCSKCPHFKNGCDLSDHCFEYAFKALVREHFKDDKKKAEEFIEKYDCAFRPRPVKIEAAQKNKANYVMYRDCGGHYGVYNPETERVCSIWGYPRVIYEHALFSIPPVYGNSVNFYKFEITSEK